MADQNSTEQLLELLIQLKKTTPKAARDILNNQPAIAYALISLMVSMGAINVEVFQKTLAQFHDSNARSQPTPGVPPTTTTPPISAIPPHFQPQYRTGTPPIGVPTPPVPSAAYGYPSQPQPGYMAPALPQGYAQPGGSTPGYAAPAYGGQPQPQQQPSGYSTYPTPSGPPASMGYGVPPPAAAAGGRPQNTPAPGFKPEMLAAFPEEQKALIMHVVSMTQDQLNKLPPEQRTTYMQIRATLGIS